MIFEGATLTAEVTLTNKSAIYSTTVRGYFLFQGITKYYQQTLTKLQTVVIHEHFENVTSGTSNLCMGGDYTDCIEVEVHPFWDALSPTDVGDNGDYGMGDNTMPVTIKNDANVSITIPVLTITTYNSTSTHYNVVAAPGTSVHSFNHTIVNGTNYGLTDCTITLHKDGLTDKTLEHQINNWEAPVQTAHTDIATTKLKMHWNDVTTCDGYQWECSTTENFSVIVKTARIASHTTTSVEVTGLVNNIRYYTRVRAKYNMETFSRWSNTITSKTFSEIGVVTNLHGSNITTTSFNANWSVPSYGLFNGYLLWITNNNSTPIAGFDGKDVGNVNTYNISGLPETKFGTQYYTYAKAYNESVTGTTNYMYNSVQLQGWKPAAPALPTTYNVFSTSFVAITTGVAGETNNPIYEYFFDLSLYSDFRTLIYDNVRSDQGTFGKSLAFTGLTTTTTYYVRCRARMYNENSSYSDPSGTLTQATATPPSAPVQTDHTSITQTTFTMNWTNGSGAKGTQITVSTVPTCDSGFPWSYHDLPIPDPPVSSRLINMELQPYTTYYTMLKNSGPGGNSPYSNIVSCTTLPTVPDTPTVTYSNVSYTSFTLSWTPNGRMPVSGYKLTVIGSTIRDLDIGNVSTYDVTGLISGTLYECHIVPYNVTGNGVGGVLSVATLIAVPVQGDITSIAYSSFYVNWSECVGATRGYKIEVSTDSGFSTIVKSIRTLGVTTKQITDLVPDTQYWVRLTAQGIGGLSDWSNVKTATTTSADTNLYLHWQDSYYNSYQSQCQWDYYQFTDNVTSCWLVDYLGNPAVNPYDVGIDVEFTQTGVYCGGQPYGGTWITIYPGYSSGEVRYTSSGTEDCGRGCEQFGGYTDSIVGIINSSQVPRIVIS